MKNNIKFLTVFALLSVGFANAQVGVGTITPDASAVLDVSSTTKGLLLPRLTTAERNLIATPATGLTIYNTTANVIQFNSGTPAAPTWTAAGGTANFETIRGTVTEVMTNSYTILDTDYAVITNPPTGAVVLTLPVYTVGTNKGKTLFIFNNNQTVNSNSFANPQPTGVQTNTQFRAMELMWTGTIWVIMGK